MNKTAVITGAGGGIGRAIAIKLSEEQGQNLVLVGRTQRTLLETARMCATPAVSVEVNVTAPDAPSTIVQAALDSFGTLDILINNAGSGELSRFFDITPERWRSVLELNTTAVFFLSRAAMEQMKSSRWGRIVNISSVYAQVVHDSRHYFELFHETNADLIRNPMRNPAYSAAKAGMEGLTRELAVVGGPWGITVNAVAPGMIDTSDDLPDAVRESLSSATPVGRFGRPEEIAHFVSMFINEEAGFATGCVVAVDGGWTLW